jgi:hypothetical protein
MIWLIELDGEYVDIERLRLLAAVCECTIKPGPDAKLWLGGRAFEGKTNREEVLENAEIAITRLNGLARLDNPHVRLFNTYVDRQVSASGDVAHTRPGGLGA